MKLDQYPFLRILIPLSLGITGGYTSSTHPIEIPALLWAFLCACAFFLSWIYKKRRRFSRRWMPGMALFLLLFSAGGFLSQKQYQTVLFNWPKAPQWYEIKLLSGPEERTRSFSFEAWVRGYRDVQTPAQSVHPVKKKILLYLSKSPQTNQLKEGELIYIRARITPPRNHGNPEEFDYRNFLLRNGISGTAYTEQWKQSGFTFSSRSLLSYAGSVRQKLLSGYQKAGIHGKEYGILAALTLGYKENLSEETRLNFSQTGISHVLALSGLHVGFVYILLEFVLSCFIRHKQAPVKQVLIIVALWGFAFLTGMLPPVIRATIMCSLVALARIRHESPLSLNTLSAAAFLMLCFRPLWLFDASFQLSFTAVAGILLWQPRIHRLIRFRNRLMRYIWNIVSVSSAAQLAVLPFILYYFSSFPCYFLLTNLVTLGLVSVIIYTGLLLLPLNFCPSVQALLGKLVQEEVHLLDKIVEKIGELPGSQFTNLYISTWEAWSLAVFILAGMYYLTTQRRKPQLALIALSGACMLTWGRIYGTLQHRNYFPSLIFYNSYHCPALHLIANKNRSFLWTDSTRQGYPFLLKSTSSFRNKLGLAPPRILQKSPSPLPSSAEIQTNDSLGIIHFQHKTICRLNNRRWEGIHATTPLLIDYLWISQGYSGKIKELQSLFHIKEIVIDASVSEKLQEELEQECLSMQLPCTRIALHGAYVVSFFKKE